NGWVEFCPVPFKSLHAWMTYTVRDTGDSQPFWDCDYWKSIIFEHGFARAFWRDEPHWWFGWCVAGTFLGTYRWWRSDDTDVVWRSEEKPSGSYACIGLDAWEYHLQTMVLEVDPVGYLEASL
ncbi:MAG: hypothetical protein JWO42_720, partial [Chloroflexi bacterium]|nr:hypothetical protein [Chloroflexota bacterium]